MSHRWKLLIAIVVVMLVLTAIWAMTNGVGPKNEVEAYKKTLIAKGEKLEISQVTPPLVPLGQNGADILSQALGMLTPMDYEKSNEVPAMQMIAPGKAIVCFQQPEIRGDSFTNSWSNVMAIVEADRPVTKLLEQAGNFSSIDFQADYTDSPDEWPPEHFVRPLAYGTYRLMAEAMYDLHTGDTASAVTNICAMLALANGERDERFNISQAIRRRTVDLAAGANWELLQSTNINDTELEMLQQNWERLEFIRAIENVLLLNRAGLETTIRKMEDSDEYFNETVKKMGWATKKPRWRLE